LGPWVMNTESWSYGDLCAGACVVQFQMIHLLE
jgi:hypothetical protein